ncbi:TonB-dependent hemoglobin/transferrin/lactoferrin family receptor [uncultured Roseibium sp.]|uniref:TonB-dependent hemoglobin/transferrin/lactoferrin family receptor n=1 Tax=uncultured Roseibium sp. TaxID=1936171 RepID=UPI0026394310|nr:TonB-dependent hemoglobin/transferrin/lactoferrin family receptor [uncultured Roseibium sp.]
MFYNSGLKSLKLATVAGSALLCLVPDTQAQQINDSPATEPQATERGNDTDAGNAPDEAVQGTLLDTITLVAGRKSVSTLDIPASVTVVDGAEIEKYGISDMQELTRYIPGVTVSRQTTATDPFNTFGGFNIRGVGGNRVMILSDGSRIPERITDGTRDYLDFNFVKQVEVIRGPASVLWGADALGGVVALETLDPEDLLLGRNYGGQGSVGYDSFTSAATASGAVAYRFSDQLSAMIALSRGYNEEPELSNARADGGIYGCPRDFSAGQLECNKFDDTTTQAYRGLAKVVWEPTTEHRLEASADIMKRITGVDYTQNLSADIHRYDRDLDLDRGRFAFEHLWSPEAGLLDELKTVVAYAPNNYDRTGSEWGVTSTGTPYLTEDELTYKENFFELDIQASKAFDTGSFSHDVIFGFDGDYTTVDYTRTDRTTDLATGVTTETRAGGFNFANSDTTRADIYIQDTIGLFDNNLEITPGVRLASYRIKPRPNDDYQLVDGFEPKTREDVALVKSLSALYHVNNTWSVWGKYGEGFKMPTAQQLYTSRPSAFFDLIPAPDLKPEEVKSYEAGIRARIDKGHIAVTGFYSDYTDFIQNFYNVPGTNDYTYRNLSSVEVWGIEVEGAYELNDNLRLNGSLAWQRGVQKANEDADTTPHTLPPLTAVLGLDYLIPDYNLSLSAVTTLAAPVTEVSGRDDGFKPGGYALLDVFGSWQFARLASLDVGVRNVFDSRYFEAGAADRTLSPSTSVARQNPLELQTGPGRTFTASLNIKF